MKIPHSRVYESYESLEKVLIKYLPNYAKTKEYLNSSNIFSTLEKDEGLQRALRNSRSILAKLEQEKDVYQNSFSEISLVVTHLEKCKFCSFRQDCKVCAGSISTFF